MLASGTLHIPGLCLKFVLGGLPPALGLCAVGGGEGGAGEVGEGGWGGLGEGQAVQRPGETHGHW